MVESSPEGSAQRKAKRLQGTSALSRFDLSGAPSEASFEGKKKR